VPIIDQGGECDCATAEELLGKLSSMHDFWQPTPPLWIFRGVSDEGYELKAKAHRPNAFAAFGLDRAPDTNFSMLENKARALLNDFRNALDRAGLSIPTLAPQGGHEIRTWGSAIREEEVPALALAQHYGLPTPLLDWTVQARVAAYFAVYYALGVGEAGHVDPNGRIAIWGMRRDLENQWITDSSESPHRFLASIKLVRVPRASNPNLHAQSGVLTWLWGEGGHTMTLDKFVELLAERRGRELEKSGVSPPVMRRLTAPRSCAPRLLRLLSYEGIDGSSMFPGYEGVVRSLKEHVLWDKPEEGGK
jgi:hypothetical protein